MTAIEATGNGDVFEETVQVDVSCTATCTEAGETIYTTRPFERPTFQEQTKRVLTEALGHDWGLAVYTWTEDFSAVTASRACKRNTDHQETERVSTTAEKVTEATCTGNGLIRYTSAAFVNRDFEVQTNELPIPATGHTYGAPEFVWTGLTACEARFACAHGDDTQRKAAVISSAVTLEPGDTRTGIRTYTASVQFQGKDYQDIREESLPALFSMVGNTLTGYTGSATEITIPDGVSFIAAGALLGSMVRKVLIPAGVIGIGLNAFPPGTEIDAPVDSYAYQWAKENGYPCTREPAPEVSEEPVAAPETAAPQETPVPPTDIGGAEIRIDDQEYTGKALKPAASVKLDGKRLVRDQDYTVSWKNNREIGKATATVTGTGRFAGKRTVTFRILPKRVSLSSLKAEGKQLTVRWKKSKGIDGYEVEYSLKKSFKGAKKVSLTGAATVKTKIGKLKAKKTYYVRVRSWKKVKGQKYVSDWSKTREITMP